MTAGGTQTGQKQNAGRSWSYFITQFLSSGAELVLRVLPLALQEHFMASRRQKCRRWKGIRVHLDYRESGVAKKKGRCCIGFHILYYSAQFFFHTDCELCHQKGVVLFHMQLYFFLTLRNLPRTTKARRSDCEDVTEINRIKKREIRDSCHNFVLGLGMPVLRDVPLSQVVQSR